jgi:UDP-N-acetyl-D-glucosamine dehydrogenase
MEIEKFKEKIDKKEVKIGIVGGGYVGLNIAALFAKNNFSVTVYDIDQRKIRKLNLGENYILDEKWLTPIIKKTVKEGYLKGSFKVEECVENNVIMLDLPTVKSDYLTPSTEIIENVCNVIGQYLQKNTLIILESTVPPGTTENVVKKILEEKSKLQCGKDFWLAFSPERIDPGNETYTLENIPKIVSGINQESLELAYHLYSKIIKHVIPVSNCTTAEFVKLMELTQRATLIAHVFELARLAEKLGINIKEALNAAKTKWNFIYVEPTCGVGGYCVHPAVKTLIKSFKLKGVEPKVLKIVDEIIEEMPYYIMTKIKELEKKRKIKKLGFLGITYKPNVKDTRASPVEKIIKILQENGEHEFIGYDPTPQKPKWIKMTDKLEGLFECDCIIIGCDHDEFKEDKFKKIFLEKVKEKNIPIIDGRNLFWNVKHELIKGVGT